MNTIVVLGSINADFVVHVQRHPLPGETLLGAGGTISPGGKGANQAVAAALQGADVAFIGAVGKDAYAEPALRRLQASGVNLTRVTNSHPVTGLAVITVSEDGENSIVVVPGANAEVDESYVDANQQLIREAEILLLQGEIPAVTMEKAIEVATGRVVINLAPVIPMDPEALKKADPLMANEHEAGLILKQLGIEPENTPQQIAKQLLEAGFPSVVLTLGAEGALVAEQNHITEIPAIKVKAVDTTGAGDAFAGAVVAKLAAGENLVAAATHATRVSAYAVQKFGAQDSYPDADDQLPS